MTWIKTVAAAAIERDGIGLAQAAGQRIAVYCVDGAFYATADACTHGYASLSEGYLEGHLVECPLHQGLFDVRTGAAAGPPCDEPVRSFPVRVEDGFIHIGIE